MTETVKPSTLRRTLRTATPAATGDTRHPTRHEEEVLGPGVYREALRLEVIPCPTEAAKRETLARLLAETPGSGIVYVSTLKDCEEITGHLQSLGCDAGRYNGRLGARERTKTQERFLAGELRVVVATSAFSFGVDKPDIRFVIHYNLPASLESYCQEAGRAGRDGEPARCVLLYQPEDRNTQIFFLNGRYPKREHFLAVYQALTKLKADRHEVAAGEVQKRSGGVVLAKVKVVLAAMKDLGIVEEPSPGEYRLLRSDLAAEELDAMAEGFEKRAEADRDRLRRMVLYAQTALCRWKAILDYFGEELDGDHCGHCDNCSKPIVELTAPPPAEVPIRAPHRAAEVLSLSSMVGVRDPATVKLGDTVILPIFGSGKVRSADDHSVIIELAEGEMREFRR